MRDDNRLKRASVLSKQLLGWVLLLAPSVIGCANLPDVAAGICGNGIVEAGEDCDSHDVGSTRCRGASESFPCRLDCSTSASGVTSTCPTGYGCGTDSVCRAPTGSFESTGTTIEGGAEKLLSGDFDGDGRADILAETKVNGLGQSSPRLYYLDASGQVDATLSITATVMSANTRDLSDDGVADLSFSTLAIQGGNNGVNVLLGQSDRTLAPQAYSAFPLPTHSKARLREFSGYAKTTSGQQNGTLFGQNIVTVAQYVDPTSNTSTNVIAPASSEGTQEIIGVLPDTPENLAGEPVAANVITTSSPCDELLLAFKGATEALIYQLCNAEGLFVKPNTSSTTQGVPPQPVGSISLKGVNDTIATGLIATHVDADDNIDVVIGGANGVYVGFGDGAGGFHVTPLANAPIGVTPVQVESENNINGGGPPLNATLPLAIYDGGFAGTAFDNTKLVVFDNQIAYTAIKSLTAQEVRLLAVTVAYKLSGVWTTARIDKLNGDAYPDIIAGSSTELDLDYYNGTPTGLFTQVQVTTEGPVGHLSIGDVDGDLIQDIVFSERVTIDSEDRDAIAIAFGKSDGGPETPIRNGNFPSVLQIMNAQFSGLDTAFETGIVSASEDGKSNSIAVLFGSGDRQPLASFGLLGEGTGGSLQTLTGDPIGIAVGNFTDDTHPDVVALAFDELASNANLTSTSFRFWAIPSDQSAELTSSTYSDALPSTIGIAPQNGDNEQGSLSAFLSAGDVDGDGIDEVVLLTSSYSGQGASRTKSPAIVIGRSSGGATPTIKLDEPLVLDSLAFRAATGSDVQVADIDADGHRDLVVLAISPSSNDSALLVLWNDGSGKFSSASATTIATWTSTSSTPTTNGAPAPADGAATTDTTNPPATGAIRAFAIALLDADQRPEIVWVTERAASTSTTEASAPRVFETASITNVAGGDSVIAADVSGDGVQDLVVGTRREMQVYLGIPTLK
ncbi:MAG: VCBS repeat-containing protein [Polyangiaceae bacterium]